MIEEKLKLLKELRELVLENIKANRMDPYFKQDIAEYIDKMTDKRRYRELKNIDKKLKEWMHELFIQQKEEIKNAKVTINGN